MQSRNMDLIHYMDMLQKQLMLKKKCQEPSFQIVWFYSCSSTKPPALWNLFNLVWNIISSRHYKSKTKTARLHKWRIILLQLHINLEIVTPYWRIDLHILWICLQLFTDEIYHQYVEKYKFLVLILKWLDRLAKL